MKVIVIVICCKGGKNGDYDILSKKIKQTWGKTETENAKVFYLWCNNYFGNDYNDFILNKEEGYGMLLRKMLGFFFKHRHDDFDYVFKVNVGSYVHFGNLLKYLEDCPREKFYSGHMGIFIDPITGDEYPFCSGSAFMLSRDLVMLSLKKIKSFGVDYIEDVSYGRFMKRNGVQVNNSIPVKEQYFWKLRHGDGQRHLDAEDMDKIHNQFK